MSEVKNKIWYKTELATEADQTVTMYVETGSLVMEITDINGKNEKVKLYLSRDEANFLALKLTEMANHFSVKE